MPLYQHLMFHYKNIFLPHYHKFPEGQVIPIYFCVPMPDVQGMLNKKFQAQVSVIHIYNIYISIYILSSVFIIPECFFLFPLCNIQIQNLSTYCRFWRHYDLFCVNGSALQCILESLGSFLNVLIFTIVMLIARTPGMVY